MAIVNRGGWWVECYCKAAPGEWAHNSKHWAIPNTPENARQNLGHAGYKIVSPISDKTKG